MEVSEITKELSKLSYMLDHQVYNLTHRECVIDTSIEKVCALQKVIHGITSGSQMQFELDKMQNKKHISFSKTLSIYNLASKTPQKLLEETLINKINCLTALKQAKIDRDIGLIIPYLKKVTKNKIECLEIKKSVFKLDNVYDASIFNIDGQIKSEDIDAQIVSIGHAILHKVSEEQIEIQGKQKTKPIEDKKILIKLKNIISAISEEKKITIESSQLSSFFVGQNNSFISLEINDFSSTISLLRFVLEKIGYILKADLDSFFFQSSSIIEASEPILSSGKLFANSILLNQESLSTIVKNFGIKFQKNEMKKNLNNKSISYSGVFAQNILSELMIDIILYSIEKKLILRKINAENIFDFWNEGIERYLKIKVEKNSLDLLSNTNLFAGNFGSPARSILSNFSSIEKILTKNTLTNIEYLCNYNEEIEKTKKNILHNLSKKNSMRELLEKYIKINL